MWIPNDKEIKPPYLSPLPAPATSPGSHRAFDSFPRACWGTVLTGNVFRQKWTAKYKKKRIKKKNNPVYSMEESSTHASFALKRWLLTSSTLPPVLPVGDWVRDTLQSSGRVPGELRRTPWSPPAKLLSTEAIGSSISYELAVLLWVSSRKR